MYPRGRTGPRRGVCSGPTDSVWRAKWRMMSPILEASPTRSIMLTCYIRIVQVYLTDDNKARRARGRRERAVRVRGIVLSLAHTARFFRDVRIRDGHRGR